MNTALTLALSLFANNPQLENCEEKYEESLLSRIIIDIQWQGKELKICCKKIYWKGLLICTCWSDQFYDCTKCGGKPILN